MNVKPIGVAALSAHGRLFLAALLLVVFAGACRSGPVSYDRHNLSRLWVPEGTDQIYFDAAITPQYPRDSATAEAARQAWMAEWMDLRKICNAGFDVVERREFTPEDDNPYLHDLRYVLRCR